MANPTLDMVHIETLMQNFSVALMQDPSTYIYSQVFGNIPVVKESDKYVIMNQDYFANDEAEIRAPGAETAGGNFKFDTDRYQVDEYGYHSFVTNRSINNSDKPIDLFKGATRKVESSIRRKLEKLFITTFMDPANASWEIKLVGGKDFIKFSDQASDPIDTIQGIKKDVFASSFGLPINTMVITNDIFLSLSTNAKLRELIKYTITPGVGAFSEVALATIFGVKKVLVAQAVESKGNYFVENTILLAYVPDSFGLECPASGATFSLIGNGSNDFGMKLIIIEDVHKDGFKVEATTMVDMKVISPVLGVLLTGVI